MCWRTREGVWVVVGVLGAVEAHRKSGLGNYRACYPDLTECNDLCNMIVDAVFRELLKASTSDLWRAEHVTSSETANLLLNNRVIHQYDFKSTKANAVFVFVFGEQKGQDRETLYAEPASLGMIWGKELKYLGMEDSWNLITSTTVFWEKALGGPVLCWPYWRVGRKGTKSPDELTVPVQAEVTLPVSWCGSCSPDATLMNLSRQFFY